MHLIKVVTFDVADLYTIIQRRGALQALLRFFVSHLQHDRTGKPIDQRYHAKVSSRAIHQRPCVPGQKYYLQMRGGVMGSAFTMSLADIYMWEWEQPSVEHQQVCDELDDRSVLVFFSI